MCFAQESDFEKALTDLLSQKGWEKNILKYPTEEELIQNWAKILFENNNTIDRLNDCPLTQTEMAQIINKINKLQTPCKLNEFINGQTITIKRDNPQDTLHLNREISLKIYDRQEISAGQSRYQIAEQPQFRRINELANKRRGDLMLLINGMPVIHIELKRTGVPISDAYTQIKKYSHEGIFSGIFSLIQIFVAMTPEETIYFANPGSNGKFNKDFYFHWANFNNEPINDWKEICANFLNIPMAHELIGFYTIADNTDGILKVMRSYQYYATKEIANKVYTTDWQQTKLLGGYIWHTTGSGKTMTSFKSAQLIADSQKADKVVFMVDRIELGTQSLQAYKNFANDHQTIQNTQSAKDLVRKLKSTDPADTLIVTSIQKTSSIKEENAANTTDLKRINAKRLVFIIDEAHRATFGEMLAKIKETFPHAIFFGFTGTPIIDEKNGNTQVDVLGEELHRYTIAHGIRDKNVLGFDLYQELTYSDRKLRQAIALEKARAATVEEALEDENRANVYFQYMNEIAMVGHTDNNGDYIKGIEDYLPSSQYNRDEHREKIVEDIINNWNTRSVNGKFHAILATSSIDEAIKYYKLFKEKQSSLKITALFDPSGTIDCSGGAGEEEPRFIEDDLIEILSDYNTTYGQSFSIPTHAKFKKDISARLSHKAPYLGIDKTPEKQIDLLIVVNQMLTGFDSKWLNTLYLDKILEKENIIQAFSRTNRLFGQEKPHGTICYYRKPHTMKKNIEYAICMYAGDTPSGLFVEKLPSNLKNMNSVFQEISELFKNAGIKNFERLPDNIEEKKKFAERFKAFNDYLTSARVQGFSWKKLHYTDQETGNQIDVIIDENTYKILALRYKELQSPRTGHSLPDIPYDIDTTLIEINTDKINDDYMNSRFKLWKKTLEQPNVDENEKNRMLNELHQSFATLTQEEQEYAKIFLNDVQSGSITLEKDKTFRDYITLYMTNAQKDQVTKLANVLGLDIALLRRIMLEDTNENNINQYGRFDQLKETIDRNKAQDYFSRLEGKNIPMYRVHPKIDTLLREFILNGGINIPEIKK